MSDLPTLLRTIAADTEATARVALAGYPERMKPHLEEAAELRAGAARVEALEQLACWANAYMTGTVALSDSWPILEALDALKGE